MKTHVLVLTVAMLLIGAPIASANPSSTSDGSEETAQSSAVLLESPDGGYEISIEEEKQEQRSEMQQVSQEVNADRAVPMGDILPGLSLPDDLVIRGTRQGGVGIGVELLD